MAMSWLLYEMYQCGLPVSTSSVRLGTVQGTPPRNWTLAVDFFMPLLSTKRNTGPLSPVFLNQSRINVGSTADQ